MSTDKDNEMWQRIEDAFTPNVAEMRRAEKDVSRVRVSDHDVHTDCEIREPRSTTKRSPIRRVSLTAALLLLTAGIGWIGKSMADKPYRELATTDLLVLALSAPDSDKDWNDAILTARGEIRLGLYTLQALANSTTEAADVPTSAKQALARLRAGTTRAVGDGRDGAEELYEISVAPDTPAEELLQVIDNIEGLVGRLIQAIRTTDPVNSELKANSLKAVNHYLLNAATAPKRRRN